MQWKQAGKTSLIALGVAGLQGCAPASKTSDFGVPLPPVWQNRAAYDAAHPDRIQSPAVTSPDTTDQALTGYDDVELAAWPAKPGLVQDQAAGSLWLSHPTLPVPSYVEVTRLDTGRTVLARVSLRAPSAKPMVIVLSEGLRRQLALGSGGQAAFRIRRVNPPEADRAALRLGQPAAERIDTPEFLLAVLRKQAASLPDIRTREVRSAAARVTTPPATVAEWETAGQSRNPQIFAEAPAPNLNPVRKAERQMSPAPSASRNAAVQSGWYVQIAALLNADNARLLARRIGGGVRHNDGYYRVLAGPFSSMEEARTVLGRLAMKGYPDARITR